MFKYSVNDNESKSYACLFSLYMYRYMILILLIILPLCIVLTLVGYNKDIYSMKSIGIALIFIEIIYIIYLSYSIFNNSRIARSVFDKNYPNGEKIISLEKVNNTLKINDIILQAESILSHNDIKKVFKFFNIIIVKLSDKTFLYFPNKPEIYTILKDF